MDIIENIEMIREYTNVMDFPAFLADRKTRDATERCLQRISEAAKKLGDLAEAEMPDLDWRGIRDIGNVLRHAYDRLEPKAIWAIVTTLLDPLFLSTKATLARLEATEQTHLR